MKDSIGLTVKQGNTPTGAERQVSENHLDNMHCIVIYGGELFQ